MSKLIMIGDRTSPYRVIGAEFGLRFAAREQALPVNDIHNLAGAGSALEGWLGLQVRCTSQRRRSAVFLAPALFPDLRELNLDRVITLVYCPRIVTKLFKLNKLHVLVERKVGDKQNCQNWRERPKKRSR